MDAYASMDSEFFLNNREHKPHSVGKGHNVQIVQESHEVLPVAQLILNCLLATLDAVRGKRATASWNRLAPRLLLGEFCALFLNHLPIKYSDGAP